MLKELEQQIIVVRLPGCDASDYLQAPGLAIQRIDNVDLEMANMSLLTDKGCSVGSCFDKLLRWSTAEVVDLTSSLSSHVSNSALICSLYS